MKVFRLVLIASAILLMMPSLHSQVKIGDNPLDIGTNRLLEIERAGELMIVTDSLEFGITNNPTSNLTANALMLKFFGYGLGNFTPALTGTNQDYFLGTNNDGEVLEFPLSLDLVTSVPSTATLSLNNGTVTFGSVDLTNLDSVFATNTALTDSTNVLRNLISLSEASDGDTITGNEWIDEIEIEPDQRARMYIYENTGVPDPARHSAFVDLGYIFVTDVELVDSLDSVHVRVTREIRDTAIVLRDLIDNSSFYTADGTFDEDRTATGAGNSLTFTGIDSFSISADDLDLTGTGNLTQTFTGNISESGATSMSTTTGNNQLISTGGDVILSSTGNNVDINAPAGNVEIDGTIYTEDYGGGNTGNEAWLLGVQADGRLVDVSLDSIGGDAILSSPVDLDENGIFETTVDEAIQASHAEIDSTIYNYNGTLTEDRVLTGSANSLTFTGLDSFVISGDDIDLTGSGNWTQTITGSITSTGSSSTSTTTGNNELTSTAGDIVLSSTGNNVDINAPAGNVEIDGTIYTEDYGGGNTGNEAWLLGVQADGRLVDVSLDSIGGDAILSSPVDLDENGIFETTVDEAIQASHAEIDSSIYNYNGTLTEDRVLTGSANSLTFTGLDSFVISGDDIDLTGSGNWTQTITGSITATGSSSTSTTTGNNELTSTAGDIVLSSTGNNVDINAPAGNVEIDGTIYTEDYGGGNTGNEAWLLGVQADGRLVDVSLDSIGGDAILSSPVDLDENGIFETTVDEAIQASHAEIDSTIYIYNGTLTGTRTMSMAGFNLYFVGSGSDTTVITDDGKIGINTGSFTPNSPTSDVKLEVNGDILAIQVHASSDERYKKNIKPIQSAIAKVMKIEGVTYDFRQEDFPNKNFPASTQIGFIAQNLEKTIPEVVMTDGDGFKAVDYSKITALLNEAIKEQQKQIEELKSALSNSNSMNNTLAKEIAGIKAFLARNQKSSLSDEE